MLEIHLGFEGKTVKDLMVVAMRDVPLCAYIDGSVGVVVRLWSLYELGLPGSAQPRLVVVSSPMILLVWT